MSCLRTVSVFWKKSSDHHQKWFLWHLQSFPDHGKAYSLSFLRRQWCFKEGRQKSWVVQYLDRFIHTGSNRAQLRLIGVQISYWILLWTFLKSQILFIMLFGMFPVHKCYKKELMVELCLIILLRSHLPFLIFFSQCEENTNLQDTTRYLKLPFSKVIFLGNNNQTMKATKESFWITSFLCSTKLTQNGNVRYKPSDLRARGNCMYFGKHIRQGLKYLRILH
jgi:hypothetical protein